MLGVQREGRHLDSHEMKIDMKRRHFIKTTLFALVAAYAPISLRPLEVETDSSKLKIALTISDSFSPDLQKLTGKISDSMTLGELSDIAFNHGRQLEVELKGV